MTKPIFKVLRNTQKAEQELDCQGLAQQIKNELETIIDLIQDHQTEYKNKDEKLMHDRS